MNALLPACRRRLVAALPLFVLLIMSTVRMASAGTSAVDEPRRLLVECPAIAASQFAVELGNLRSDIALGNVTSVIDSTGHSLPWSIAPDRDWVVFESVPGERCEILISPSPGAPPPGNVRQLPGILTLTSCGIWVREGDHGTRLEWLSNRLARVAGAVLDTQDRAEFDRALATHADQLEAIGLAQISPAPPYDLERRLVAEQPDFTALMGRILEADLRARAEIFVTPRRTLRTNTTLYKPANVAEIRPWDVIEAEGVAASLKGSIIVERDATLTFNAYSVFGGALRIDGRTVATIRLSQEVESEGWRVRVPVALSAGLHEIELIAQGNQALFNAGITWTPPGGQQERHMNSTDFSPAVRTRVLGLYAQDRSRTYPLVRLTRLGRTGLREQARYWATLHSSSVDTTWSVNGCGKQGESIDVCVPANTAIEAGVQGTPFSIRLDEERFRFLGGAIDARAELPHFIFNGEQLKGRMILLSEAEIPLTLRAEVSHARKQEKPVALINQNVALSGRGSKLVDPFAPGDCVNLDFDLDGRRLKSGDTLDLRASCLPESFLDERIKLITPEECAGVQSDQDGCLRDASGTKVLVLLTRPSLSDKRRWEVARGLLAASRPPRRLLVVAAPEEWGDHKFSATLEKQAKARGSTVRLEPWTTTPAGVPRILGSIGNVTKILQTSDYDAALFLPPLSDLAEGGDERTLSRAMACLVEVASARLGRQRVWLALPPAYRPDALRSANFEDELVRVVNNYGINPLPLAAWLEQRPDALKTAYAESGVMEPGPVELHGEIATYLIRWIYGE